MKLLFYIYLSLCVALGVWLGLTEWDGFGGILGGGFIGLIIGLALFACFTIIMAMIQKK